MSNTSLLGSYGDNSGAGLMFRNRIVNGCMRIDQRNAGASVTPTNGQYTLDRWQAVASQTSKYSVQRSSIAPSGFTNSILFTSLSAYTVGVSESFRIQQAIEGFNVADFDWGTSNAKSITISFWARSSLTGTFGGAIFDSISTYSFPFSYTISAANTWEYKTVSVSGPTSGTWNKDNTGGLTMMFSLGAGANISAAAGSWASGTYVSATGATSVVGTNGATLYITGVQLEAGPTATPFERRPIGVEQNLCFRYAFSHSGTSDGYIGSVAGYSSTVAIGHLVPPVPMRATPSSIVATGTFFINLAGTAYTMSVPNTLASSTSKFVIATITGTGFPTNAAGYFYGSGTYSLIVSAEL